MPPLYPENDVTAYIVIEDFGQYGRAFRETDLAEADLGTTRCDHGIAARIRSIASSIPLLAPDRA
jgi:hypothetical protein